MAQPLPLAVVVSALSLLLLSPRTSAAAAATMPGGKPLVTAISKDGATKLYTAPLLDAQPLVLDLSGPLISSTTCPAAALPSYDDCHPPGCNNPRTGPGPGLTRPRITAYSTDGANPLAPVSFPAVVAACAPPQTTLLAGGSLPAGAVGVAGLARSELALPAQVARSQKVARKFALCLPSLAIFGGGPLFLLGGMPTPPDFASPLAGTTPLRRNPWLPGGYFVTATGIAVNQEPVQVKAPLAVALSSRVPYTVLRPDVYAPVVRAFDAATAGRKRMPAAPPFELCYDSRELSSTRLGYGVPQVDLALESGATWMVFGANSLVQVSDDTACFAFLEMKEEEGEGYGGYGGGVEAPAVVIGGFQMENNLLVFDDEKGELGFSGLLFGRMTTCSNFNFTLAG